MLSSHFFQEKGMKGALWRPAVRRGKFARSRGQRGKAGPEGKFGGAAGMASTELTSAADHLRKVFYHIETFGGAYDDRYGLGAAKMKFTRL